MGKKLTIAQRRFFESYLCEMDEDLRGGEREPFTNFFKRSDFDGPAGTGEIRVAKNLLESGYLKRADTHTFNHLYVQFTEAGAAAMWWVHNNPISKLVTRLNT